jgi:hypothetical protein
MDAQKKKKKGKKGMKSHGLIYKESLFFVRTRED